MSNARTAAPLAAALALGLAHHQAGRLDAAAACYRTVLAGDPQQPEALHRLGLVAYQQGRAAEAVALIGRALTRAPGDAGAHNNLSLALMALGRHAEAATACDRAVALRPDNPGALSNRGIALRALGRAAEAAASLRRALALRPDFPEAHMNLGLALADLGQAEAALASYDRAVALRPDYAEALSNRGTLLLAQDRAGAALASLERAAALRPDLADIAGNRGNALRMLGRHTEALASYDNALARQPANPATHANRALVLLDLARPAEALASAEQALHLDPARAAALATRGAALGDLGRLTEAYDSYARAVALAPHDARIALSAASLGLRLGRLAENWPRFNRRWDLPEFQRIARGFTQPMWQGEPLAGRTLLLHADQGLGDTLQFCRYLPLLAGRGRVLLEVQRPLLPLLAGLPGAAQVFAAGDALPAFDLHCPLLNLPGVFGTDLASIPPVPAALRAQAAPQPSDRRLRVGLAWSGNPAHQHDASRSMPLAALRPLAGLGAAWHVVQTEVRPADRAALAGWPGLHDLAAGFADFADTAAAMAGLDLVIAVDTSVAHLAASLGRPTWIMLAAAPDWRWLLDRDDSPWYPAVRLFRQRVAGDWAGVVARVAAALADRLATHGQPAAWRAAAERGDCSDAP